MAISTKWTKVFTNFSLGFVLILAWTWMYLRADQLFPVDTEQFRTILTTYMLITAFIFSWDTAVSRKVESPIFKISFLKSFPQFLLFAGISLAVLFLFGLIYQGDALPSIYGVVSRVGFGVILTHALFVAILEEKIFRNWLPSQLQSNNFTRNQVWIFQAILFALFHYVLGRTIWSIVIYLPLAFIFMYARMRYSPKTDMANSGMHFAWNLFILGFLS